MSQRDGNSEIYVMNRNGSGVRRLTNNAAIDSTPTWSPTGTQIAFTSDRSGSPQIWVMDTDGLNVRASDLRRILGRPRDVVARPVQRNRLLGTFRARLRRQDLRCRHRSDEDADRWRRHQRKPRVFSERAPYRVHIVAARQDAHLHDGARRQGLAADHADGQQHVPELVELKRRGCPRPSMEMVETTSMRLRSLLCICLVLLMGAAACGKSQPPVARPTAPRSPAAGDGDAGAAGSACADARADAAAAARRATMCRVGRSTT